MMGENMSKQNLIATRWSLIVLACLALSSCKGTIFPDDDGGTTPKDQFIIQSISLQGSTQDDCTVTVESQADQDGVADQSWQASFDLNDGAEPDQLPADLGGQQVYQLNVKATRASDGEVLAKRIKLSLYQ